MEIVLGGESRHELLLMFVHAASMLLVTPMYTIFEMLLRM